MPCATFESCEENDLPAIAYHFSTLNDAGPRRASQLENLLRGRSLVLDGAMGTMIRGFKLSEADFRGQRNEAAAWVAACPSPFT